MNAYIIKGFRSAVGKAKRGGFRNYRSDDLAVDILTYLASQVPQLDPKEIDDVIGKIVLTFMMLGALHRGITEVENSALPLPRQVLLPRVAFYAFKKECLFAEAVGEISAEQISFYPPGIPVLVPGEEITEEIIAYCQELKAAGIPVSGPQDSSLERIQVVKK